MSVDVGSAIAYLDLDTTEFENGIQTALTSLKDFGDNASLAVGSSLSTLGHVLTRNLTVPIANLGQTALDSFKDYESAFAGVKKTVDDAQVEMIGGYEVLSDAIEEMATRTASTVEEIAGAMEVAGQLGVPLGEAGKDIIKFTETMIQLGDSTNLSSEEAATSLARFMNITGTAWEDVDRLGSAIVDLGNNFAAQEDEITYMATRLASAGTIAGLTETEILALATAMTSVGIKAEAGGTAMSTTLAQIEKAVAGFIAKDEEAIKTLEKMAEVAGMSADEFVKAWEEEPIKALQNFLVGVGALEDKGESAVIVLDELGMSGVRQSNMLKALGLAAEQLTGAIDLSNKAWEENTALTTEAEKRYETLDSRLSQLNEEWKSVQRDLAEILLPYLEELMEILKSLIEWWRSLSEEQQNFIVKIAALGAAVGPFLTLIGNVLRVIGFITEAVDKLTSKSIVKLLSTIGNVNQQTGQLVVTGTNVTSMFSKIASSILGVIKTISGIAGVIFGAITAISNFFKMLSDGFNWVNEALMILGTAITAIGAIILGAPALITSVVAASIAALATFVVWVKDNWESLKVTLNEVGEKISNLLKDLWESISGFFTNLFNKAGEFFNELMTDIKAKFQQVISETGELIKNIVTLIKEFIFNIISIIGEFFQNIFGSLSDFGRWVIDSITSFVSMVISLVSELFWNIIGIIVDGMSNTTTTVLDMIGNIFNEVMSFLGKIFTSIMSWFFDLVSSIPQWLGGIADTILQVLGNVGSAVLGFLANIAYELASWFEGLGIKFLSWGFNLIGNLLTGLQKAWENVVSWIRGAFSWVTDFISNLSSKISNAFSNLTSRISGSHANGLDYVPFDGYVAQLHQGERVLTKEEAEDYNGGNGNGNRGGDTFNFYNTKPDPYEYARQIRRVKKEIEEFG